MEKHVNVAVGHKKSSLLSFQFSTPTSNETHFTLRLQKFYMQLLKIIADLIRPTGLLFILGTQYDFS